MKKIIIIILFFLSLITLLFFGFKTFVISIKETRGCEFANIDNIEINVGIDVPEIEKSECNYDSVKKVKSVYFKLKKLDTKKYISKNKFSKLDDLIDLEPESCSIFYQILVV